LAATQNRLLEAYSTDATKKYLQLLKTFPDILQRVPQYMIASYRHEPGNAQPGSKTYQQFKIIPKNLFPFCDISQWTGLFNNRLLLSIIQAIDDECCK
jgi:hypothetical protein